MAQYFSLTRKKRPVGSTWAIPTAAFSKVPRKRSSLSRWAVTSVWVPNQRSTLPDAFVGHPGELGDVVGQRAEPLLALAQRFLGPLPLGDVPRQGHEESSAAF